MLLQNISEYKPETLFVIQIFYIAMYVVSQQLRVCRKQTKQTKKEQKNGQFSTGYINTIFIWLNTTALISGYVCTQLPLPVSFAWLLNTYYKNIITSNLVVISSLRYQIYVVTYNSFVYVPHQAILYMHTYVCDYIHKFLI